ncbi:hypothetical protein PROFUN_06647 [Planoprotostelium fungivorum]|uniref:Uncharacterized protein n=1 Tax=Planoprotostelium fungivorum TaxID=1890364 RepID=A0A2P6MSW9_9EUKA|nr:hypothetical protein PROFUN_06647 [Planoprotostelium fungivorum]
MESSPKEPSEVFVECLICSTSPPASRVIFKFECPRDLTLGNDLRVFFVFFCMSNSSMTPCDTEPLG